jgi:glycosyltransferase involved in cell wall biosynthesis
MTGSVGVTVFLAVCGLITASWLLLQIRASRSFSKLRWSRDLDPVAPAVWPPLSVIIPACDEESSLEEAVRTVLSQDYEPLEIVLINDRSRDETLQVMRRIEREDSRVQVIDIQELPQGWLGKVHALHQGTRIATGDLLLYTDADVNFQTGFFRKTVAWMLEQELDHLTIGPEVQAAGFWQEVAVFSFMGMFSLGMRADEIGKPGSDAYIGIGAFNMVRRTGLERTPGFEWLKMEIVDDVGLGLMLHRAGGRAGLLMGMGELWLDWYPSLRSMFQGLEKNMFGAVCRFSYGRLFGFTLGSVLFSLSVPAALIQPYAPWLRWLGLAVVVGSAMLAEYVHRLTGKSRLAGFFAPLGSFLMVAVVLRSGWKCFRQGGIKWRGTFYPLKKLREGQRVKL